MARVVICPSCQSKGSVPDGAQATRIRCPKCGQAFDVKAASQPSTGTVKRPAPGVGPRRPAAARSSAFEDVESVQPLAPIDDPGHAPIVNTPPLPLPLRAIAVALRAARSRRASPWLASLHWSSCSTRPARASRRCRGAVRRWPRLRRQRRSSRWPRRRPRGRAGRHYAGRAVARHHVNSTIDRAEVVRRLKEATVYIKNKIAGKTLGSGTGFVIEVTGRHRDPGDQPARRGHRPFRGARTPRSQGEQAGARSRLPQRPGSPERASPSRPDPRRRHVRRFRHRPGISGVKGVKRPPTPINLLAKSETTEGHDV